jgi:hypothetical protein
LRVHSGETILVIRNLKQSEQIREPVLQVGIESSDLGCDLSSSQVWNSRRTSSSTRSGAMPLAAHQFAKTGLT